MGFGLWGSPSLCVHVWEEDEILMRFESVQISKPIKSSYLLDYDPLIVSKEATFLIFCFSFLNYNPTMSN